MFPRVQLSFFQSQHNFGSGQSAEVDQLKRDKSTAVGLVNSMQKDMSKKVSLPLAQLPV